MKIRVGPRETFRISNCGFNKGRCWALGADIAKVNEQN